MTEQASSHGGTDGENTPNAFANCILFAVLSFLIWLVPLFVTAAVDLAVQPLREMAYCILYLCLVLLSHVLGARFINVDHKWVDAVAPAVPVANVLERGAGRFPTLPSGGFWHSLLWAPLAPVLPLLAAIEASKWVDTSFDSMFLKILGYLLAAGLIGFCSILLASLVLGLWPKHSDDAA